MYLSGFDMVAIMIALVVSLTLVATTALANARMHKEIVRLRRVVSQRQESYHEKIINRLRRFNGCHWYLVLYSWREVCDMGKVTDR